MQVRADLSIYHAPHSTHPSIFQKTKQRNGVLLKVGVVRVLHTLRSPKVNLIAAEFSQASQHPGAHEKPIIIRAGTRASGRLRFPSFAADAIKKHERSVHDDSAAQKNTKNGERGGGGGFPRAKLLPLRKSEVTLLVSPHWRRFLSCFR